MGADGGVVEAGALGGEGEFEEFGAVVEQEGDAVAGFEAE